jgi:hypothetical protein
VGVVVVVVGAWKCWIVVEWEMTGVEMKSEKWLIRGYVKD